MTKIIETLSKEEQSKLLEKTLEELKEKLAPYFEKEILFSNSHLAGGDDSLNEILCNAFLTEFHYYLKAGKQKIFIILPGFPGPKGFFGRKATNERKILAGYSVSDEILPLIKEALKKYAAACYAEEVILQKF